MSDFHVSVSHAAAVGRDAVGRLILAEVQIGAAMAWEEFFAQAERNARQLEEHGQPEIAAAIRAECARLRTGTPADPSPGASPVTVLPSDASPALPTTPTPKLPAASRKPAKKALPPSPPDAADPFAPPQPPWLS